MKRIIYRKNWTNFYKEFPESELSTRAAKKRHENRKRYAVVIENDDDVRVIDYIFFPDFTYCIVLFVDEFYREHLTYFFHEIERDRQLFLSKYTTYYYKGPGPYAPCSSESYSYSRDGKAQVISGGMLRDGTIDPALLNFNYEPVPAFGEYDSILRFERTLPPEEDSRRPGCLMIDEPEEPIDWSTNPTQE